MEVQILDDAKPEGPERFQLILSEPSPGLELGINTTGRYKDSLELFYLAPETYIFFIFQSRMSSGKVLDY